MFKTPRRINRSVAWISSRFTARLKTTTPTAMLQTTLGSNLNSFQLTPRLRITYDLIELYRSGIIASWGG
jgi:hypothetical protein